MKQTPLSVRLGCALPAGGVAASLPAAAYWATYTGAAGLAIVQLERVQVVAGAVAQRQARLEGVAVLASRPAPHDESAGRTLDGAL